MAHGEDLSRETWDEEETSYPLLSSEQIWTGPVFGLRAETVALPGGGGTVGRQFLDHGGAVGIVALRSGAEGGSEVLLQQQYRHPVRARLWEIPAGLLDVPGEDPLLAAKRELREEADLGAHTWNVLVDLFTSPGASSEMLRIYLATDLYEFAEPFPRSEEEADMLSKWVSLDTAAAAVLRGDIHSPSAIAGILAAQVHFAAPSLPLRRPDSTWFMRTAAES